MPSCCDCVAVTAASTSFGTCLVSCQPGPVTGVSEAEGLRLRKPSVSRILRLALLAPDVVEEILAGSMSQGIMLEELERPPPASWEEQRVLVSGQRDC